MDGDLPTLEYFGDEGYVRLNLRRPVNIYVPSDQKDSYDPQSASSEPDAGLELEWVYGYRGKDCRDNLHVLESGEVVYFVAAVAVVHDIDSNVQRHYAEHTDDIKCLAVHPDKTIVATGQVKGRGEIQAHVRVWNSTSMETLQTFGGEVFDRGLSSIAFSLDGEKFAAVDEAVEPRLSVWDWQAGSNIAEIRAHSSPVFGVTFSNESTSRIVTTGKGHLAFWTLTESGELERDKAIFGDAERPKFVTTVATLPNGNVITGDSNGSIFVWANGGKTIEDVKTGCHDGPIFSLIVTSDGKVISAGRDKKIIEYDETVTPTGQEIQVPEKYSSPRVVANIGGSLAIGTTGNAIIKMTFGEEDVTELTQGHLEELWGLAVHPSNPHFVSAGQDSKVYYRDADSKTTVWFKDMDEGCQSADFSPTNDVLAVGTMVGKWVVIDSEQEIVFEATDGEEPIQMIKYSPNGERIAVGSRDNCVYIYQVGDEGKSYSKIGSCEGHSSFITHLDWSADGEMIRTNSGDYELLFWKAEDCSQLVQAEDTNDVQWATNSCILSFHTVGIWPQGTDGTDINSANKAVTKELLASGDDFGHVKLFSYPAISQEASHKQFSGHSSHVTSVLFFCGDSRLLSAGGRDTAILQWKINE